ncbi:hypothetical protein CcI156_04360 [Frankia sp. CcI156]|uniref:hypothetical protein n=1 Tax=Frankia TaxID=1854 RepID=UPI0002DBC5D4|nr:MULTISPECIES: hypothetical protein [Frankia]EYT90692.1 hypothetical protein ThrDRAFT_03688 [Frankia casuarinae]KFB05868.1 hypothetical protein ALLO2DRAFT_01152 [Frankia sp. Allo2]OAA19751.1 hypothetical protein AAY23_11025 [Frankia casuarinae]OHV57886.1 hypothetical protein CgIS1_01865 [Frankia sp. CgIS1]ONH28460.1 hypothetical protein CcI156_04360 [Frankia sp. CcI156]
MVQVLADADNLAARWMTVTMRIVGGYGCAVTAAGAAGRLAAVRWPAQCRLVAAEGWQRADLALAGAYRSDEAPLLLVTGDGDFAYLASRHPGPVAVAGVLVARALRDTATVIDLARDGAAPLVRWLNHVSPR